MDPITLALLVAGGSALAGIIGSAIQGNAATTAANTQAGAAQAGIAAQQDQFQKMQEILAPYVQAGQGAMSAQQALLGLGGQGAQQSAIQSIQSGPEMQAMQQQGENAILQNAAATGGLRGGNVQSALAQFRPQLLSQLINQRFSQLGSLAQLGQASAAGQAAGGMNLGSNIANLLQQQGAAQAGGQLAQGNAWAQGINAIPNSATLGLGLYSGMGGRF